MGVKVVKKGRKPALIPQSLIYQGFTQGRFRAGRAGLQAQHALINKKHNQHR